MLKRDLHNDTGSAFVELALVTPLLLLMMIGAAELGRIAYFAIEVSNAARAAVAYGSQSTATASDFTGMQNAAINDASSIASLTFPSPGVTNACVCQTANSGNGATTTTAQGSCASISITTCPTSTTNGVTNTIVEYVQASTQAQVSTMFRYPGIPRSFTLHGFAQMRVIQN
jgi:Flp pilus assembly protein TadG